MARQSRSDIDSYVNELAEAVLAEIEAAPKQEPAYLEPVLNGRAIELWSDAAGQLFIVADEEDARRLGEPRGTVYTADELRRVVHIGDPAIVLEIHEWKRIFDARLREYQERKGGA